MLVEYSLYFLVKIYKNTFFPPKHKQISDLNNAYNLFNIIFVIPNSFFISLLVHRKQSQIWNLKKIIFTFMFLLLNMY